MDLNFAEKTYKITFTAPFSIFEELNLKESYPVPVKSQLPKAAHSAMDYWLGTVLLKLGRIILKIVVEIFSIIAKLDFLNNFDWTLFLSFHFNSIHCVNSLKIA